MARFLWGEVGCGDAGIEAAGGKPEHGGGDDDDAYGGHNASYITHPGRIDKGLELPVSPVLPQGGFRLAMPDIVPIGVRWNISQSMGGNYVLLYWYAKSLPMRAE